MEEVRIIFSDGMEITAERNGSSYITDIRPAFPPDLTTVTVEAGSGTETLHNAEVIECYSIDDRYWFAFREIPESEMAQAKTDAQVLFTALMTDTLLEED